MTMSTLLKLALIQLRVGANKADNLHHAATMVATAAKHGAQIVCLPECFNSPYGIKYFPEFSETIPAGETCAMLSRVAKEHGVWLVGGSIPERRPNDDHLYNTNVTYNPNGELVGTYSKLHLFDIDVPGKITFKESTALTGGKALFDFTVSHTGTNQKKEGDKSCADWRIGMGICYDVRFPELAHLYTRNRGCQLLIYPGAFNMTTGPAHWELLARARAVDNQCYVAMCGIARDTSADYVGYGHSIIVGPWGDVLACAEESESVIFADLDLNEVERVRSAIPVSSQRRLDLYTVTSEKN